MYIMYFSFNNKILHNIFGCTLLFVHNDKAKYFAFHISPIDGQIVH